MIRRQLYTEVRVSRLAILSRRIAGFSLPVVLLAIGMHRFGLLEYEVAFAILLAGLAVALLGVLVAGLAFIVIWNEGLRGLDRALMACAIGVVVLGVPAFMRVARASTLTLARREFVIAAQALGATHARILLRELLPNVLLPLLAFFLLGVAVTIVVEGALSFLGLGVPPPISSWGSMIGEGRESLEVAPRLAFLPAIAMFLTVLSFNLVGDTLRAITDPRQGAL